MVKYTNVSVFLLLCEQIGCKDDDSRCTTWQQSGACDKNSDFMLASCKLSCKVCGKWITMSITETSNLHEHFGLFLSRQKFLKNLSKKINGILIVQLKSFRKNGPPPKLPRRFSVSVSNYELWLHVNTFLFVHQLIRMQGYPFLLSHMGPGWRVWQKSCLHAGELLPVLS